MGGNVFLCIGKGVVYEMNLINLIIVIGRGEDLRVWRLEGGYGFRFCKKKFFLIGCILLVKERGRYLRVRVGKKIF